MQTPGHIIINLGLLGGKDRPHSLRGLLRDRSRWTWPIIAGGLLPDLMLFWFYFWTKAIRGLPDHEIWNQTYWLPGWQDLFAPFNSIPLALIGVGCSIYWQQGGLHSKWAGPTAACFASILLHCLQGKPTGRSQICDSISVFCTHSDHKPEKTAIAESIAVKRFQSCGPVSTSSGPWASYACSTPHINE